MARPIRGKALEVCSPLGVFADAHKRQGPEADWRPQMGTFSPAAVAARSCFWFKLWLRSERRSLRCSLGIWCCCRCLPPPCPRIAPTRSRTRLPDPPRGGLTFEGHSRSSQWGGYLQRWPGLLFCGPGHHFLSDCDGFLLGIGISERT